MAGFSKTERDKALGKIMFQTKDMTLKEIATKLKRSTRTLEAWSSKYDWKDMDIAKKIEAYELNTRRKEAEKLGIGILDQMSVISDMMKAKRATEDGKETLLPDYPTRERGVKLAMKILGTEMKPEGEPDVNINQMQIINYRMPMKQSISNFVNNNDSTQ